MHQYMESTSYLALENAILSTHVVRLIFAHMNILRLIQYWFTKNVNDKLRWQLSYIPVNILNHIQIEYGVKFKYHKAWRGKEIAMDDIHEANKGCFNKLKWYYRAVNDTNPESIVYYEVDPVSNKIIWLFICFTAYVLCFLR